MKKNILLLLVASIALIGCSQPKIDGSSLPAMQESIENVRDSLNEEKLAEFQDAVETIADEKGLFNVPEQIDGMTADDVIAKAAEVVEEAKEKKIKKLEKEISDLEQEKIDSEKARDALKPLSVKNAKFYFTGKTKYDIKPIIELTIVNGLGSTLSAIEFEAVLHSPGRDVPWLESGFSYTIPGGIQSGEELPLALEPNRFSEWGNVPNDRSDIILTLTPAKVFDAEGSVLFDVTFDGNAVEYLESRREELSQLKE